jgi:hypothetical protein
MTDGQKPKKIPSESDTDRGQSKVEIISADKIA